MGVKLKQLMGLLSGSNLAQVMNDPVMVQAINKIQEADYSCEWIFAGVRPLIKLEEDKKRVEEPYNPDDDE